MNHLLNKMTWGEKRAMDKYEDTINAVNAKLISPDVMNEDWFIELQEQVLNIIKESNEKGSEAQQGET